MSVRSAENLNVSLRAPMRTRTRTRTQTQTHEHTRGGWVCNGICCGARAHLLRVRLPGTPDFESCQLVELF